MISGLPPAQWPQEAGTASVRDLAALATIAFVVLVLEAGGDGVRMALRFDRGAVMDGQGWRLLTGHLVHLGWAHALMNLAALSLLAVAARPWLGPGAWALAALASAAAVDLGLWLSRPAIDWYVGLSGILHGLAATAGIVILRDAPLTAGALLLALAAKLAWEAVQGPLPLTAAASGGEVVVAAHLWGALGGAVVGLILAGLRQVRPSL